MIADSAAAVCLGVDQPGSSSPSLFLLQNIIVNGISMLPPPLSCSTHHSTQPHIHKTTPHTQPQKYASHARQHNTTTHIMTSAFVSPTNTTKQRPHTETTRTSTDTTTAVVEQEKPSTQRWLLLLLLLGRENRVVTGGHNNKTTMRGHVVWHSTNKEKGALVFLTAGRSPPLGDRRQQQKKAGRRWAQTEQNKTAHAHNTNTARSLWCSCAPHTHSSILRRWSERWHKSTTAGKEKAQGVLLLCSVCLPLLL